jgi:hypothetical protein
MSEEQKNVVRRLAIGRILRLASRPSQEGDARAYLDARHAFLSTYATHEIPVSEIPVALVLQRYRSVYGD